MGTLPRLAWAEIMTHDSRADIWVVIDGAVYDMTEFIGAASLHPGGDAIPLEYAGKDASAFWRAAWPRAARPYTRVPCLLCVDNHLC